MMTQETLREAVARAVCPLVLATTEYYNEVPPEEVFSRPRYSFLKDACLFVADAAMATMFERLRTPSEVACVGLARDIMMWLDMEPKTPRALFKHLERIGREIPQWLRDEPEMQSLDHVPSKATRCAIIWQAMLAAFQQENSDA